MIEACRVWEVPKNEKDSNTTIYVIQKPDGGIDLEFREGNLIRYRLENISWATGKSLCLILRSAGFPMPCWDCWKDYYMNPDHGCS